MQLTNQTRTQAKLTHTDMGTVVKQNLTVLSLIKVILALVSVICIKHAHCHSAPLINRKLHRINYQHAITQPSHIIHF